MAGKLFVIDGVDGSGKNTQAKELYYYFLQEGYCADEEVIMVSFPRYGQPSAKFVEMYLHGELAKNAMDMDPYTASLFYAIDRSISFKTEKWGEVYRNGGIVIADRYFTSNIIHQGAKILANSFGVDKFREYINWLKDLELNKIGIPKPDKIFWLVTDAAANAEMMKTRVENDANHVTDIHEADTEYLNWCRSAIQTYKQYCHLEYDKYIHFGKRDIYINTRDENNNLRSIININSEIIQNINDYLHL